MARTSSLLPPCPACSGELNDPFAATAAAAALSPCGHYRWWLSRSWQPEAPALLFIGLNPSRADAARDDPTLRRLQGFARQWGYGSLLVLNLFARISASPALLRRVDDPVGAENDATLQQALRGELIPAGTLSDGPAAVWLGWGNQGGLRGRDCAVLALLHQLLSRGTSGPLPELLCLGLTAAGQPRHPLYVQASRRPQRLALAQTVASGAFCDQRVNTPWLVRPAATPFTCT